MSILSRPRVARTVARAMQFGTRLGDRTMDKRAARRLPEYPNTP